MHNFCNGPSLKQSYSKVPCITSQCIYTCITYGTVPCVTLQKYFRLVLWVHIQDIIVSWISVQSFTNDPLHIQIGQEFLIELVKYKFQGGWFIQFKIQYQLRIKGPKTKCIKTLRDRTFAQIVSQSLWNTHPLSIRSIQSDQGFKQALKTFLFRLALAQWTNSCTVIIAVFLFSFSLKCTVCYVLLFVSFNLLVL